MDEMKKTEASAGVCSNCGDCHSCRYCGCMHHKIVPGAILLIALVFLLKALGVVSAQFADLAWPIILGAAFLTKVAIGQCKCYKVKM